MPEIGASLREARLRAKVDINDVELATKIRAKYIRALENEEWGLLPGPAYVKSFLRTYADALGLDGKLLVDEYKLRHERLSDVELQPIAPRRQDPRRGAGGGRRGGRAGGRGWVVVLAVAAVVAGLYFVGRSGNDSGTESGGPATTTSTRATTPAKRSTARRRRRARATVATLTLVATRTVYVCLEAAG